MYNGASVVEQSASQTLSQLDSPIPRGRSSMVEPQSSKLITRVRFPSPAPSHRCCKRVPSLFPTCFLGFLASSVLGLLCFQFLLRNRSLNATRPRLDQVPGAAMVWRWAKVCNRRTMRCSAVTLVVRPIVGSPLGVLLGKLRHVAVSRHFCNHRCCGNQGTGHVSLDPCRHAAWSNQCRHIHGLRRRSDVIVRSIQNRMKTRTPFIRRDRRANCSTFHAYCIHRTHRIVCGAARTCSTNRALHRHRGTSLQNMLHRCNSPQRRQSQAV